MTTHSVCPIRASAPSPSEENVPAAWHWVRLRDVARLESGHTPSRREPSYWGGDVPWLSLKDIRGLEGRFIYDTADKPTELGIENSSARMLPEGTVAFCRTASVGEVVILGRDMATSQDFANWVCGPALLPEYLYEALRASSAQFDKEKQGTTHKTIYMPVLEQFHVMLPPIPQQQRIASILDKADGIRRKRREAIALTEELLRATFLEMVGPAASGFQSWPEKTIEDLAAPQPNAMRTGPFGSALLHSEFVEEGIAVLGIDNAVQNRFAWGERRFITEAKYEELQRYTVKPGDVIITIMGTTGRSAVVPHDIPLAITTKHLATITCNREMVEPEFISQAIHRHPHVLAQIAAANRGAIMSGLNLGLIKALRLRVPPLDRQKAFSSFTAATRSLEEKLTRAHAEADALFASLVHRAFRGELTRGAGTGKGQLELFDKEKC